MEIYTEDVPALLAQTLEDSTKYFPLSLQRILVRAINAHRGVKGTAPHILDL